MTTTPTTITEADVSAYLVDIAQTFPFGFLSLQVTRLESSDLTAEWAYTDATRPKLPRYSAATLAEVRAAHAGDTPEARRAQEIAACKARLAELEGRAL